MTYSAEELKAMIAALPSPDERVRASGGRVVAGQFLVTPEEYELIRAEIPEAEEPLRLNARSDVGLQVRIIEPGPAVDVGQGWMAYNNNGTVYVFKPQDLAALLPDHSSIPFLPFIRKVYP